MKKNRKITFLCKKYGAEMIAQLLVDFFVAYPREIDNFKEYVKTYFKNNAND